MEEVYLISSEPSYDSTPYTIGFVLTIEDAEAKVKELSEAYKTALLYNKRLIDAREIASTKISKPEYEQRINVRWPNRLKQNDISQEMRAGRDRINFENKEIDKRNCKKSIACNKLINEEIKHIYDEIPENIKVYFKLDNFYMVDILNVDYPYSYSSISKLK